MSDFTVTQTPSPPTIVEVEGQGPQGPPGTIAPVSAAVALAIGPAAAAGATGTVSDAGHVHPDTGLGVLATARTWTAQQTMRQILAQSSAIGTTAVIVKAIAGQTADLLQYQDSTGAVLTRVDPLGNIGVNNAPNIGAGNAGSRYLSLVGDGVGGTNRGGRLELASARANGSLAVGDEAGRITWFMLNQNGGIGTGGTLSMAMVELEGAGGVNGFGSRLRFQTKGDNATTTTEALRLDSSQRVGVAVNAPQASLHVSASGGTNRVQSIIQGVATQTNDLTQWQNSSASTLAKVDSLGNVITSVGAFIGGPGAGAIAAWHAFTPDTSTRVVMGIRGATSQSADLTQWQKSTGSTFAGVATYGIYTASPAYFVQTNYPNVPALLMNSAGYWGTVSNIDTNKWALGYGPGPHPVGPGQTSLQWGAAGVFVYPPDVNTTGLVVQGNVSQVAALQQWQTSTGSTVGLVGPNGRMAINPAGGAALATITSVNTATLSLVDSNTAGITLNRSAQFDIYDDGGRFNMRYDAQAVQTGLTSRSTGRWAVGMDATQLASLAVFNTTSTSDMVFLVKGAASQSGELTQWQNSSGTPLAKMSSAGALWTAGVAASSDTASFTNAGQVEARKTSAQFWGQTTPGTWGGGGVAPAAAVVITNTNPSGYDPVLLFRMATSASVIKPVGAIDFIGTSSWTDGSVGTQTADMLFIVRDAADTLVERFRIGSNGTTTLSGRAAGQAQDRLQVTDGVGGALHAKITGAGALVARYTFISEDSAAVGQTTIGAERFHVETAGASVVGLGVRGAAAQSSDLQQWKRSDNAAVASIGPAGEFFTSGGITVTGGKFTVDSVGRVGMLGQGILANQALSIGPAVHPGTGTSLWTMTVQPTYPATTTVSADNYYSFIYTAATTAMTTATHFHANGQSLGSTSTIGTVTGLQVDNGGGTGITNTYGVKVAAQSGAGTLNIGARIDTSTTAALWLGGDQSGTTVSGGITFGSGRDTSIFRVAANSLQMSNPYVRPTSGNAVTYLDPVVGSGAYVYFAEAGVDKWIIYRTSGDGHLYFRDAVNSRMVMQLSDTIANGDTAMQLARNNGAIGVAQVSMGATDSGGVGFKLLRVPN